MNFCARTLSPRESPGWELVGEASSASEFAAMLGRQENLPVGAMMLVSENVPGRNSKLTFTVTSVEPYVVAQRGHVGGASIESPSETGGVSSELKELRAIRQQVTATRWYVFALLLYVIVSALAKYILA